MSSASRAWSVGVAASVGTVEALKDQGICRWNHVLRSAQQHVKSRVGSLSQTNKLSSSAMASSSRLKDQKAKQSEESLRTVMYLSCWGPNWFMNNPNLISRFLFRKLVLLVVVLCSQEKLLYKSTVWNILMYI